MLSMAICACVSVCLSVPVRNLKSALQKLFCACCLYPNAADHSKWQELIKSFLVILIKTQSELINFLIVPAHPVELDKGPFNRLLLVMLFHA